MCPVTGICIPDSLASSGHDNHFGPWEVGEWIILEGLLPAAMNVDPVTALSHHEMILSLEDV